MEVTPTLSVALAFLRPQRRTFTGDDVEVEWRLWSVFPSSSVGLSLPCQSFLKQF